jgi:hypothetical protein
MSKEENQPKLCICSAPIIVSSITLNGVTQPAVERCSNIVCDGHRDPAWIQEQYEYRAEIHTHQREMEKLKADGKLIPTFAEWKAAKTQQTEQPIRKSKRGD